MPSKSASKKAAPAKAAKADTNCPRCLERRSEKRPMEPTSGMLGCTFCGHRQNVA